jgi:hypothetical protein
MEEETTTQLQEEQPQPSITRRVTTTLQYHTMTMREKVKYGAVGGGLSAIVLELFGAAGPGLGLAALIAFSSGFWSEELQTGLVKKLPRPRESQTSRQSKLAWWLGTEGNQQPTTAQPPEQEPEPEGQPAPALETTNDIDALFQTAPASSTDTAIPRLMPNDIIRNTPPDDFRICIGRSLTKKGNPPIWINFYGQHLKLIGASQYGKSSMAACILYLITRTHAPSSVLIALLDMEYKTSKLFTDCQHLAEVNIAGKWVTLHAKNREQVLEHLGHVVTLMEGRYTLTEEEVEQEPILLVYLEEFLALKDYFKRLIDSLSGEAKEAAKKDYAQLVFSVSEIARRGLKVKVQLLMCAQVDYRDDDFQEALVNITGGMSFCVRASAAQAAGFVRADLLKRNVEDDKKGQAVTETPDCKDLVLAPEYDLKKKLLALEKQRQAQNPTATKGQRPKMVAPANTHKFNDQEPTTQTEEQEQPEQSTIIPTVEDQRKLTTLHRRVLEHYRPGIPYREMGETIGVGKDKAGDLIKELKKWGFLKEDGADE